MARTGHKEFWTQKSPIFYGFPFLKGQLEALILTALKEAIVQLSIAWSLQKFDPLMNRYLGL